MTTFCNTAMTPAAVKTPEALSSSLTLADSLCGSILRDLIFFLAVTAITSSSDLPMSNDLSAAACFTDLMLFTLLKVLGGGRE